MCPQLFALLFEIQELYSFLFSAQGRHISLLWKKNEQDFFPLRSRLLLVSINLFVRPSLLVPVCIRVRIKLNPNRNSCDHGWETFRTIHSTRACPAVTNKEVISVISQQFCYCNIFSSSKSSRLKVRTFLFSTTNTTRACIPSLAEYSSSSMTRASPKSAILQSRLSDTRTLAALRSLWM